MNSMTGFGRGEASGEGVTVTVEMKSVNNRFRDLQLRCPREYMAFEPRIATAPGSLVAPLNDAAFHTRAEMGGRFRRVPNYAGAGALVAGSDDAISHDFVIAILRAANGSFTRAVATVLLFRGD